MNGALRLLKLQAVTVLASPKSSKIWRESMRQDDAAVVAGSRDIRWRLVGDSCER